MGPSYQHTLPQVKSIRQMLSIRDIAQLVGGDFGFANLRVDVAIANQDCTQNPLFITDLWQCCQKLGVKKKDLYYFRSQSNRTRLTYAKDR